METLENTIQISEKYPLATTLDWEAEKWPICNPDGEPIQGFYQLKNSRTQSTIAVHKNSYQPIFNDQLQNMAEKLVSFGGFSLQGYASYNGGRKVMAYLKQDGAQEIAGQLSANYLIIGNSHDGSTAFFSGHTNRIFRCENMFTASHMANKIWHTANSAREVEALQKTHDLYYNKVTGIYERAEQMQETPTQNGDRAAFVKHVLQIDNVKDLPTVTKNRIELFNDSINTEVQAVGLNAFGLFNGATHYTTHAINQKRPMFGNPLNNAYQINKRAFDFCAELAQERKKISVPVLLIPEVKVNPENCPF